MHVDLIFKSIIFVSFKSTPQLPQKKKKKVLINRQRILQNIIRKLKTPLVYQNKSLSKRKNLEIKPGYYIATFFFFFLSFC